MPVRVSICPSCLHAGAPGDLICASCGAATLVPSAATGDPVPPVAYVLEVRPGLMVVGLQGEIDLSVAPVVRQAVEDALGRAASALVLDLSAVTFADSTAIATFIGVRRALGPSRRLHTILPAGQARAVFELTGVLEVLGAHDDHPGAFAAASGA